jgi:hypothetical protein
MLRFTRRKRRSKPAAHLTGDHNLGRKASKDMHKISKGYTGTRSQKKNASSSGEHETSYKKGDIQASSFTDVASFRGFLCRSIS